MKSISLFLGTFLIASCIQAQTVKDTYVVLHGLSKHANSEQVGQTKFRESNIGVGYRVQKSSTIGYQVGTYKNSYNKHSIYLIGQYTPFSIGDVSVGGFTGLATGYKSYVVGGFMLDYKVDKLLVTTRLIPKINQNTVSVLAVELGFKF
jgi:hypothetical protein